MELGREKIMRYTGDDRLVLGMDVLNPFFQAALFVHDRKLLRDLDPLTQSAKGAFTASHPPREIRHAHPLRRSRRPLL